MLSNHVAVKAKAKYEIHCLHLNQGQILMQLYPSSSKELLNLSRNSLTTLADLSATQQAKGCAAT
jgi:hypothetical protein